MANTLGVYNPIFYANEALMALEKALGMAGRVYRGYDEERRAFGKGDVINIRRPSTFTAADAPATASNVTTDTVAITLNKWREVKFKLTDKELAFTGERIVNDHIRPAAYALADDIDQTLAALWIDIPWVYSLNATPGSVVADITGPRKILFDNAVPVSDGNLHYMIDSTVEANLLGVAAFTQNQGAGQLGVESQLRGTIGTRYGAEFFANQNVKTYATGAGGADVSALINNGAGYVAGTKTVAMDGVTVSITNFIQPGDTFVITGNTQRYVVTAAEDSTAGGALAAVEFEPGLAAAVADNAVVTFDLGAATATRYQNLLFHKNAFAIAMAPLSEMGNNVGASIATITDPITGLSLRSRVFYMPDVSEVNVAIDVLYGVKTLDRQMAVRAYHI